MVQFVSVSGLCLVSVFGLFHYTAHNAAFTEEEGIKVHIGRDTAVIFLSNVETSKVFTNRELYGRGFDAYFMTNDIDGLKNEFMEKGANIIQSLEKADNKEFVVEDIDGRWLCFGITR